MNNLLEEYKKLVEKNEEELQQFHDHVLKTIHKNYLKMAQKQNELYIIYLYENNIKPLIKDASKKGSKCIEINRGIYDNDKYIYLKLRDYIRDLGFTVDEEVAMYLPDYMTISW